MRSRSRLESWEYMPSLQYSFVIQVVLHYWQDITLLDLFYLMSWKRLPHALLTNRLNRTSCCDVRNAIECAHGRLKARYPVLSVSLNFKLHEVPVTIITCFVLRNWWEDHGWKICTFFSSGRPRFTYLWVLDNLCRQEWVRFSFTAALCTVSAATLFVRSFLRFMLKT